MEISQVFCLICEKTTIKMMNLYESDEETTGTFTLLTGYQVEIGDFLCKTCSNHLSLVVDFREKCLNSNYLQQKIKISAVKDDCQENIAVVDEEEWLDEDINEQPDNEEEVYTISEAIEEETVETENEVVETQYFSVEEVNHPAKHTVEVQNIFKCNQCDASFKRKESLKEHLNLHSNSFYKCDYEGCHKMYWNKFSLTSHMQTHSTEVHQCESCTKSFMSKALLRGHIKQVHATSNEQFICEICHKSFKNRKMLYCHSQLHVREKKFDCQICQKKFITNAKLNRHISHVHSNEKAFKCEICSYSTPSNSNYKRHMTRHERYI